MNALEFDPGTILIPMTEDEIAIGDTTYRGIVVVARLLSMNEIEKILQRDMSTKTQQEIAYEQIFGAAVISIPGVDGVIDINNVSAGMINTVARIILSKSLHYINDPVKAAEEALAEVSLIDSMCAVISRFLGIGYLEARALPLDRVFHMYATCRTTFPNEVNEIQEPEGQSDQ